MSNDSPPAGAMYLYDYAEPPLRPGDYRFEVGTTVAQGDLSQTLGHERYFSVVGPRFTLNPGDIAGVVPPRNATGPFGSVLSQIVLRRRTLPWERVIADALPAPAAAGALPNQNPAYPTPWLALLLLVEGEDYELKPNLPLESVLPGSVYAAIGSPQNVLVEALDIDRDLLDAILPSREELQLLAHVRQVNAEDRELSVEGSDGWFSVVVGNRLPLPGKKCRMVLVSLEGRTDLVATNPPAAVPSHGGGLFTDIADIAVLGSDASLLALPHADLIRLDAPPPLVSDEAFTRGMTVQAEKHILTTPLRRRAKLVALHSWTFTCEGEGDFMGLMQRLDVGLIGKTRGGKPKVTDTGHIPVELGTRSGTKETALYRGPLVPMPLQRDPAGPYHSADQARRIAPEAGVQDISYASAFEVGRLLAAADARLAQELMRWRRSGYTARARLDVLQNVESLLALDLGHSVQDTLMRNVLPLMAGKLIDTYAKVGPPIGDAFGLGAMQKVAGLQPEVFARVFELDGAQQARDVLLGTREPLGTRTPKAVEPQVREDANLDRLLRDVEGLSALQFRRGAVIGNVKTRVNLGAVAGTVGTIGSIGPAGPVLRDGPRATPRKKKPGGKR